MAPFFSLSLSSPQKHRLARRIQKHIVSIHESEMISNPYPRIHPPPLGAGWWRLGAIVGSAGVRWDEVEGKFIACKSSGGGRGCGNKCVSLPVSCVNI